MSPVHAFMRMVRGKSLKDHSVLNKKHCQKRMNRIISDALCSAEDVEVQLENPLKSPTPKYVRELMFLDLSKRPVKLLYNELLTQHQWLHCILAVEVEDSDSVFLNFF